MKRMFFTDNISIKRDGDKTVISVRDGVQEYAGIELGLEPYEKTFKVYRSPETIKEIKDVIVGIPVTRGHVDLEAIPPDKIIGFVDSSEIVEYSDKSLSSSLAIKNDVKLSKNMVQLLNSENQLSLGYFAETKEHDFFDLEQVKIVPHHLAIVENGRCGEVCKFRDERKEMDKEIKTEQKDVITTGDPEKTVVEKTDKENKDVGMKVNLQRIAEVVKDLPEAVKLMNLSELEKLVPKLEEAIKSARAITPNGQEAMEGTDMEEVNDEGETAKKEEPKNENFKDSTEFKDAVKLAAEQRVGVILKAKNFLDEGYNFGVDTTIIMRDVLATQTKEKFKDEEVGVAFRMLKKLENYSQFADSKGDSELEKLKDKEI